MLPDIDEEELSWHIEPREEFIAVCDDRDMDIRIKVCSLKCLPVDEQCV
jgi:hypothetical protein